MNFIEIVAGRIIPAAYDLLPSRMADPRATRMLLATNWQESRCLHRYQIVRGGGRGPARGLWQFEAGGGVKGVLEHAGTKDYARHALAQLGYDFHADYQDVWASLEHNDVLAATFARLLLWTLPDELPTTAEAGWDQYLAAWRPGKPHHASWPTAWYTAHEAIR